MDGSPSVGRRPFKEDRRCHASNARHGQAAGGGAKAGETTWSGLLSDFGGCRRADRSGSPTSANAGPSWEKDTSHGNRPCRWIDPALGNLVTRVWMMAERAWVENMKGNALVLAVDFRFG